MQARLNPYISFHDNASQAMEFYQSIFGGKLDLNTFKESHVSDDPAEDDKIMHAMLTTDNDMVLMASDTPNQMEYKPAAGMSISLSGSEESELRGYFDKLAEGGMVAMPLEKALWGDIFGMVVDKFGISWMVNVDMPKEA